MTDAQYLLHFIKLHNLDIEKYHEYSQQLCTRYNDMEAHLSRIMQEHSINLLPYLFTSHITETNLFKRFLIYCTRYIDISIKDFNEQIDNDIHFFKFIANDMGDMIIALLLMQYYFL
mgnify:CR=1 FL=1